MVAYLTMSKLIQKQLRLPKDLNDEINNLSTIRTISANSLMVEYLSCGIEKDKTFFKVEKIYPKVELSDAFITPNLIDAEIAKFLKELSNYYNNFKIIHMETEKKYERRLGVDLIASVTVWFSFSSEYKAPKFMKVEQFDNLSEPSITIDLNGVIIGLMKSQYDEVKLSRLPDGKYMISYYALRATITSEEAKQLIDLGFKLG